MLTYQMQVPTFLPFVPIFFLAVLLKLRCEAQTQVSLMSTLKRSLRKQGLNLLVLNHHATDDKLPPEAELQLPRVSSLRQIKGPHPEVSHGSQVLLSFTLPKPNPNLFTRAPETKVLNFQLLFHQNTTGIK